MKFDELAYSKLYKSGDFYITKTPWFADYKRDREAIIIFHAKQAWPTILTRNYYDKKVAKGMRDILADAKLVTDSDGGWLPAQIFQFTAKILDKKLK